MKVTYALSLLFTVVLTAGAAFQYDLKTIGNKYSMATGPYGMDYKLVVSEGAGSIYLSDILRQSPQFTNAVNVANNDYGFVDLNTGKLINGDSSRTITLANGTIGYKLGDFSAGDEIGIWVKTAAGTGLSVFDKSHSSANFNYRTVENQVIGNMGFNGKNSVTVRYLVSGVEGEVATPTGQPLPGVLTSLLLGSGALGGAFLKKRIQKK